MDWRNKPKSFWREKLTDEQFKVTQEAGTEAPFTGAYWNEKSQGEYKCVCCGTKLFNSTEKYDSGCGWPSFTAPKDGKAKGSSLIEYKEDNSWFMTRTEVLCNNCGAHLGHVFDDGPTPEGQRYCINSASLNFEPNKKDDKK